MLTSQCILKSTMSAESKHFHCQFSYAIKIMIDINHVILIIHPQGRANWIKMSIFWSLSDPIMCQIELLTIRLCSKMPSQIKYVGLCILAECWAISRLHIVPKLTECWTVTMWKKASLSHGIQPMLLKITESCTHGWRDECILHSYWKMPGNYMYK